MNIKLFTKIISLTLVVVMTFTIGSFKQENTLNASANSVEDYNAIIAQNKVKQEKLNALIAETRGDATREKENQQAIKDQIAVTQSNINTIEELITKLEGSIEKNEKLIAEKEKEIQQGVNDFKKRLRAMYLSGGDSVASVILGSDDFYDMLMKVELVKRVAKHDNDAINDLIAKKEELQTAKNELEDNKTEVENQNKNYKANKSALYDLYNQSKENLADLAAEEAKYKEQIEEIKELDRKAEAEIKRLIEEAQNNSQLGEYVGGVFGWPVPGFSYISSYYGPRWGRTHKGIDIAGNGISGAKAVSANSGVVIVVDGACQHNYPKSSNCCGNGYGRYVIVDHGGGFATLYGHLDQISVQEGQYINKGDKIGTVGSTGFSTGYHLHYEILRNGVAENPLNHYSVQ